MVTDVRLLEIEIDTLWSRDARGRLLRSGNAARTAAPHLVLGVARDGTAVALGSELADDVARDLLAASVNATPPTDPAVPPPVLAACREILERSVGAVRLESGPSFLVPAGVTFPAKAEIRRSADASVDDLRDRGPAHPDWSSEDWRGLLDGEGAPWAAAIEGSRVISICHSPRLTGQAAEAGVWTHPGYRGRGHGAAVTAAWAALAAPGGRTLFYSTSAANASSQRVASRLGLPLIGWLWTLTASRPAAPPG